MFATYLLLLKSQPCKVDHSYECVYFLVLFVQNVHNLENIFLRKNILYWFTLYLLNSIHNRQDKSVVTHINIDNRFELRFYNGHS